MIIRRLWCNIMKKLAVLLLCLFTLYCYAFVDLRSIFETEGEKKILISIKQVLVPMKPFKTISSFGSDQDTLCWFMNDSVQIGYTVYYHKGGQPGGMPDSTRTYKILIDTDLEKPGYWQY